MREKERRREQTICKSRPRKSVRDAAYTVRAEAACSTVRACVVIVDPACLFVREMIDLSRLCKEIGCGKEID